MSIITDLLDRAKIAAEAGRAESDPDMPERSAVWDALDRVILLSEDRVAVLEGLGLDGLRELLYHITSSAPFETRISLIGGASNLDELAQDARLDAAGLDADTISRREARQARIDYALRVGEVGLRLLLRFAVGV